MRILIVGSGGREHALAWRLSQEAEVAVSPGNPGIARAHPLSASDPLAAAREFRPDLVVIGPEEPLVAGLADRLRDAGFAVFGPGAEGARLEGSKAFAKAAMKEAGIPTARALAFGRGEDASKWIEELAGQVAVKASGNALGKGVVVCGSIAEAAAAVEAVRGLGPAADKIVIEERLEGRELSLLTLCSDCAFLSLPPAQDHKRAFDGDEGPNTGGMGAFSPIPGVTPELVAELEELAVRPLLRLLASRGVPFRGCLFTGFMLTAAGPKVLEYNVRFGDPETQAILPRLGTGFAAALLACARGEAIPPIPVSPEATCAVVVASPGYPGPISAGRPIQVGSVSDAEIFFAGVGGQPDALVTSGGRVATVVGRGPDLASARARAHTALGAVAFEGAWSRSDIGAVTAGSPVPSVPF